MSNTAYFLWVGGTLPDIARVSVLSAAEAGFDTVLFTDQMQDITHPALRVADYREISLPWGPEDVRLKEEDRPCYAAFSDLFRFALLARHDGWWFDCDTIILRPAEAFAALLKPSQITVGREDAETINGAVLGSLGHSHARHLYDTAAKAFPVLERWGVVGPALITRCIAEGSVSAHVLSQEYFYPIQHADIASIYRPEDSARLQAEEPSWYCLSVWGEVLSRSGLKHLAPPDGSYLADLLARHPKLGGIGGDGAKLAAYLAENLQRLDEMDSGSVALRTLMRKAGSWLRQSRGVAG